MTVAELIRELSSFPKDEEVRVSADGEDREVEWVNAMKYIREDPFVQIGVSTVYPNG